MNLNATLFVQTVVLLLGAWVTMKFIWPPLIGMLDERRQKIADGLAAADRGNKSLTEASLRIEQLEAEARNKAQAIIADTERRAQGLVDEAKNQARVEAERLVEAGRAEAEQQLVRARNALRDQVAGLVVAGAEQILRREVDARVHAELLDQLKQQL